MVLGVMEGQIRGGYFPDYIFDPSVVDCTVKCIATHRKARAGARRGTRARTRPGNPRLKLRLKGT